MKNAKSLPIIIASIILVAFCAVSFVLYDASESIAIRGVEGSYAQTYANENGIEFLEIHDSENDKVEIPIIDEGKYAENTDKEENNKEQLATPEEFKAQTKSVTSIALTWNPVKKADSYDIYMSDGVSYTKAATVDADSPTSYLVEELEADTTYFFTIQAVTKDKNTDDSEFSEVVYAVTAKENGEFSYDYENNAVNITDYKGAGSEVIVPETIDELPVQAFTMDVLNRGIKVVQIPESVTRIESKFKASRYNAIFFIALAIMLIGYIFSIIATLIGMKKSETTKATFYGIPFVYSGITTFILITILSAVALKIGLSPIIQVVVAIVIIAVASIRLFGAGVAREIITDKDEEIQQRTQFIKLLSADAQALITDAKSDEAKALAKKVYEAIRFSDPMSSPELAQIEAQIQNEFNSFYSAILSDNTEQAEASSIRIIDMINIRSNRCKALK